MRAGLLSGLQRIVFGGGVRRIYANQDLHRIPDADRNNHRNAHPDGDMDTHVGADTDLTCELPPHGTCGVRFLFHRKPALRVRQRELAM
jgi:hypothetical protein